MIRQSMSIFSYLTRLLLLLLLLASVQTAWASCNGGGYRRVVPLGGGNYSLGEDAPIGTVIYRQVVRGDLSYWISCSEAGVPREDRMQISFRVDEKRFYMRDYIVDVGQGIGLRFRNLSGETFGSLSNGKARTFLLKENPGNVEGNELSFIVEVIKIDPHLGGATFHGDAYFPKVVIEAAAGGGHEWSPLIEVEFTGNLSLNIDEATCQIANERYTYTFPSKNITEFPALGSASDWLAAPVTLRGCSAFSSNHSGKTDYASSTMGDPAYADVQSVGDIRRTPSTLTLTLEPQTPVLDSDNGVIAIESGADAALGIGIQLGMDTGSGYQPLRLNGNRVQRQLTPVIDLLNRQDITYRLGARLIRTGEGLKGGKIRAQVTYTVTYF